MDIEFDISNLEYVSWSSEPKGFTDLGDGADKVFFKKVTLEVLKFLKEKEPGEKVGYKIYVEQKEGFIFCMVVGFSCIIEQTDLSRLKGALPQVLKIFIDPNYTDSYEEGCHVALGIQFVRNALEVELEDNSFIEGEEPAVQWESMKENIGKTSKKRKRSEIEAYESFSGNSSDSKRENAEEDKPEEKIENYEPVRKQKNSGHGFFSRLFGSN